MTATTTEELETRLVAAGAAKADSEHHRLPQFYLRGFAGQGGQLRLLDPSTGHSRLRPPRKAFAEAGYYTIRIGEDLEPNALIEELYGAIENDAAPVHRRLVAGASPAELSLEERINYAAFLAAQVTRGDNFREADRDFADQMGQSMLRLNLSHWDEIRAGAIARGEEPPPELTKAERESLADGGFRFEHSPEMTAHLSLTVIPDLSYILADFAWHVVHFDEPCLLTSEHPVSYWRPPSAVNQFMGGIGPISSQEVRVPLSPSVALVLTNPELYRSDRKGRGGRRAAAILNFWTWRFQKKRTLVMSPDVATHPLPMGELLTVPFRCWGTAMRDPGPVIDF